MAITKREDQGDPGHEHGPVTQLPGIDVVRLDHRFWCAVDPADQGFSIISATSASTVAD